MVDYLGQNLGILAWSLLGAILGSLFTYAWIWRTRDRQIARAAALAQLEQSPSISPAAQAALQKRIRAEADDILAGDQVARAWRVQQTVQALLFLISLAAVAFLAFGTDFDSWNLVTQFLLTLLVLSPAFLAVAITNVPAYRWRMPRWLHSYRPPGDRPVRRSFLTDSALSALRITPGQDLALYASIFELDTAREAVGENGHVYFVCADRDRTDHAFDYVLRRRWNNVTVVSACLEDGLYQSVDPPGPVDLPPVEAAIVIGRWFKSTDKVHVAAGHLAKALQPTGRAFVQLPSRIRPSHPTPGEIVDALQQALPDWEVLTAGREKSPIAVTIQHPMNEAGRDQLQDGESYIRPRRNMRPKAH